MPIKILLACQAFFFCFPMYILCENDDKMQKVYFLRSQLIEKFYCINFCHVHNEEKTGVDFYYILILNKNVPVYEYINEKLK